MTAARLALYGAIATAMVWTFKALAIWEAGGLNKTDLEDLGWAAGTLLFLATWAALGVAFAARRTTLLRILAGVAGVVLGLAIFSLLDGAADLLPDSAGWVQEEAGLWAAAVVTLLVAWWLRRRTPA